MTSIEPRTFDTGAAGYGVVILSDLEQFEIIPGHSLSAPEIAHSQMAARLRQQNGNLGRNESAVREILEDVAAFIGREMTSEEYRTACVMLGRANTDFWAERTGSEAAR